MNLPNAITVGRIAVTPLIALLPFVNSWPLRAVAFVIYIITAISDYWDGMLARSRGLVTDLGKLLDPLADKLLLLGTFVPMYLLGGGRAAWSPFTAQSAFTLDPGVEGLGRDFPFITPLGAVGLPLWIVLVVLGRELLMTVFRQIAAKRGVVIAAIGPAKWKAGFQYTWVGATYFWFAYATWFLASGWTPATGASYRYALDFAYFNGIVATLSMIGAVALTLYSILLYMRRYGYLLRPGAAPAR
jgi:phosphatidylglycerophosphate synthase